MTNAPPSPASPYIAPLDGDAAGAIAPRVCGRCRQLFEGDPTLSATAMPEWWACPPCRLALGMKQ